MTHTATWALGDILPGLLLRTVSGSVVITQVGSVLKSTAYIITKGYTDARGLDRCLRTIQLPTQNLGYEVAHPNIHHICELLTYVG